MTCIIGMQIRSSGAVRTTSTGNHWHLTPRYRNTEKRADIDLDGRVRMDYARSERGCLCHQCATS
ncbi:hypothetical protein L798_00454 [Zootermopsis nevadensis]|uniref:Uncharacterized protein n=1 Tax=Zootermopsis nevadensis TaxID=136037 RepID=A0A067RMR3_ZOONE|nr:hypothetical protein L798_00454 [Zootermopsis nevadensis]